MTHRDLDSEISRTLEAVERTPIVGGAAERRALIEDLVARVLLGVMVGDSR